MFEHYDVSGKPIVYESVGRPISRVVRLVRPWAYFNGYQPIRYKRVKD
jgi:hypothetical protein